MCRGTLQMSLFADGASTEVVYELENPALHGDLTSAEVSLA
jgi:hypothetical protein